jgi:hypothetical protein
MNRARTFLGLFIFMFCASSNAAQAQDTAARAHIVFADTAHDFGSVQVRTQATYHFEYRNTGNDILIVTEAQPSCYCISVNWSRSPVMPGDKGSLEVVYHAEEVGAFDKGIWVSSNSNTAQPVELRVRGNVVSASSSRKKKKAKH